jgi:hypothetical protein
VICSEYSLHSPPLIREIERALQKEDREHRNVLFPILIDDYLLDDWDQPRKADVVSKVIGDFRGSDNPATYGKAFPRFLYGVKPTDKKPERLPGPEGAGLSWGLAEIAGPRVRRLKPAATHG